MAGFYSKSAKFGDGWKLGQRLHRYNVYTDKRGPVHTMRIFSVQNMPKKFQNSSITGHLGFAFTRSGKSHDYCDVIVFEKFPFQNIFRSHYNAKPAFSNFCRFKNVFEKFRFRDGVWMVNLTVESCVFKFLCRGIDEAWDSSARLVCKPAFEAFLCRENYVDK